MPQSLKILCLSAEVDPFAKKGGLADVAGSLPKALRALGHDVRVVMPAYQNVEESVRTGRNGLTAAPIYFIAEWNLFNRPEVYGYWDDPYRFAFFSRAALDLTLALDWRPDVVHAHDWHAAPAVTWLATAGQADDRYRGIPSLFTIHNLAHQGNASWDVLNYLGVITHGLAEEKYGEVNFMARGIYHATLVNTVSPTYAREIMTKEGGAGLDGLLRYRSFDVHGILNGLDYDVWNPAADPRLAKPFDADHLDERLHNKHSLQARARLPQRDDIPLVAMVSRLEWQKGLDIVGHVVHLLMNGYSGEAQFVVLGQGAYEGMFAPLAAYHHDKMTAFLSYEADLAPLIRSEEHTSE